MAWQVGDPYRIMPYPNTVAIILLSFHCFSPSFLSLFSLYSFFVLYNSSLLPISPAGQVRLERAQLGRAACTLSVEYSAARAEHQPKLAAPCTAEHMRGCCRSRGE